MISINTRMSATILDYSSLPNHSPGNVIASILNIVFAITASISVLMIVIGGMRYITAHGDASATERARSTIIYAVVGLVITMAAFSIVTFVIGKVG